jgi:hypothetical protein
MGLQVVGDKDPAQGLAAAAVVSDCVDVCLLHVVDEGLDVLVMC